MFSVASQNHLEFTAGPDECLAETPQQQIEIAVSPESKYSRIVDIARDIFGPASTIG